VDAPQYLKRFANGICRAKSEGKMKTVWVPLGLGLFCVGLVIGCGPKQQTSTVGNLLADEGDDVDLVEELTGIDENTPVAAVEDEEERPTNAVHEPSAANDQDFIGGPDGVLLGRILINGQESPGTVTVKTVADSPEIIMQGAALGHDIQLAPGRYDFIFKAKKIVGDPEFALRDVEIPAGRRVRRDVKMPVGEITLVTGAKCKRKPIRIKPKDAEEWYSGKFYTCTKILLKADEYEAETMGKGGGTAIRGIQVYEGSIRNVLIRSQD
jgi:hypothetical protein